MNKKILFLVPFMLYASQIKDIRFTGLTHFSKVSALNSSLLQKGDEFNLKKIENTIKNYYSYGYFKDIKADFSNGILTYEFTEKPSIFNIQYHNVSEELKKLLQNKIKRGMILSDSKLNEIKNFIVGYYDAKGKFDTVVVFDKKFPSWKPDRSNLLCAF